MYISYLDARELEKENSIQNVADIVDCYSEDTAKSN